MKKPTLQEYRKYNINRKYQRSVTNQIYIYPLKIENRLSFSSFSSIDQSYNLYQQNKSKSKSRSKMNVQLLNLIEKTRSNYQLRNFRKQLKELSFDQPEYSQCFLDQDTAVEDGKNIRSINNRNCTCDRANQNKILEKMKKKTHKKQSNSNLKKTVQIQVKKAVREKKQLGQKIHSNKIIGELIKKLEYKNIAKNDNKSTKKIINKKFKKLKNNQRIVTQYC